MQTKASLERVWLASARAQTVNDLAVSAVPDLLALFDASLVEYFRFDNHGGMQGVSVPGADALVSRYSADYVSTDPVHAAKLQLTGPIMVPTRHVTRKAFVASAAYADIYKPAHIAHMMIAHLAPADGDGDGLGVVIARSAHKGDFTSSSAQAMRRLFPTLVTAAHRLKREQATEVQMQGITGVLEHLSQRSAVALLDRQGTIVWQSNLATRYSDVLESTGVIVTAARQLCGAPQGGLDLDRAPLHHAFATESRSVTATLEVLPVADAAGPFILVTFKDDSDSYALEQWASVYGLTKMERTVAAELARGFSNIEIGRSLFISPATVRTHVEHLLKKLRVASRLQVLVKMQSEVGKGTARPPAFD